MRNIFLFLLISWPQLACDDNPPEEFFLHEHYIVVDFIENGACPKNVEFKFQETALLFQRQYQCQAHINTIPCPNYLFASNHIECIDNWGGCKHLDRVFFLESDTCRIIIDVDAAKAIWSQWSDEIMPQLVDQPNIPYNIDMSFKNPISGAIGIINESFTSYTFNLFPTCHSDGLYKISEYDDLYNCISSMPPHVTVNLIP